MKPGNQHDLIQMEDQGWWILLEATALSGMPEFIEGLKTEHKCLFQGNAEKEYAEVAPHLIQINRSVFDWVEDHIWDKTQGVFIESEECLLALWDHFRQFLLCTDETGKMLFFRYYDPSVLKVYLQNCNSTELIAFFGSISSFLIRNHPSDEFQAFFLDFTDDGTAELRSETVQIAAPMAEEEIDLDYD